MAEEEGKIPVFTVLKNNTILKNIFIVNKPPDPSPSTTTSAHQDLLLVGRHPDCDLMLTHPSISRFHLQIRSTPSSQSLSVVDLSSVHGTWVSERKVEPGVSVEMKEGDTLRIGVSSRVYRLHWIPISRAYDLENPFLSRLDVVAEEQEGEEEEEYEEDRKQSLKNFAPIEMEEIQSVHSVLERISPSFLDENLEVTAENEIPAAAPPMPEDIVSFCCEEERKSSSKDETFEGVSAPFGAETSHSTMTSKAENKLCGSVKPLLKEIPSAPPIPEDIISFSCEGDVKNQSGDETFGVPCSVGVNKLCDSLNLVLSPPYVESVVECDNTSAEYLLEMQQFHTPCDAFTTPSPSGLQDSFEKHWSNLLINTAHASFDEKSAAEAIIPTESEFESTVNDNGRVTDILTAGIGDCQYENTFLPVEEGIPDTNSQKIKVVEEVAVDSLSDGEKQDTCGKEYESKFQPHLNAKSPNEQGHSLDEAVKDIGNKCPGGICSISLQIESENSSTPLEAVLKITKENQTLQSDRKVLGSCVKAMANNSGNSNIWSRRGKASSAPQIRTSKSTVKKSTANVDTEVEMSKKKDIINKTISKNLFSVLDGEEEDDYEVFTPDKENFSPNTLQFRCLKKKGRLEEIKHCQSQRTHISKDNFSLGIYPDEVISPITSCKKSQKDLFSVLDGEKEVLTPDKENFSPNTLQLHRMKKMGNLKEITCSKPQWSQNSESKFSSDIYPDESISPTSNKENQTPKVAQEYKSRRKPFGSLEVAQRSQRSKSKFSANIYPDVGISPTSEKENPTPKVAQEHKSQRKPFGSHVDLEKEQDIMALNDREERVPFQLLMYAGDKSRSGTSCPASATKSIDVSDCAQILDKHISPCDISWEQKQSWDMVVDTASLMNKESRKALQLLQGLKGTRLIIPRLVIRELDNMKRQFLIFRRTSEASLVLEWIEECMAKTSWWIHIQSSMEEERLIAPTPPASPHTQFSEESWTFPVRIGSSEPSSRMGSMEVAASPTAEDHILDFALLHRRRQNDVQVVLLSEDTTLKIKCMAEGLLCETVQEFRESLVNPFSGRFLWTDSSPRGQTWSCQDDVVLRERYCRLPMRKKSSKGVASGLKLILLHNSQYRH